MNTKGRPANISVGDRFYKLTVLSCVGRNKAGARLYLSHCECGGWNVAVSAELKRGHVMSCGCSQYNGKNRQSKHPLYQVWSKMIERCQSDKCKVWKHYGGRGISVCDRWVGDFWSFVADMGERPSGNSIDRIDNDGPYSPENCRWATARQQNNNKRTNVYLSIGGERKALAEWATEYGVPKNTVYNRHKRGWTPIQCVSGKS